MRLEASRRSWPASHSHGNTASTAGIAQAPSPTRQPPKASEIGTVSISAAVRPVDSAVV